MPTDEEAMLLKLDPVSPILVLERISYGGGGACLEHSRTRYAADRYSFEMRLVIS
jgi:DNA-binding GntR family transcriptional regulator